MLTREKIMALRGPVKTITIKGTDETVCLRSITGGERRRFRASVLDPETGKVIDPDMFDARFAALVLGDETGSRMFSDQDAEALNEVYGHFLDQVVLEGLRHNGMADDSVTAAEKNSEATPSKSSGSDSPDTSGVL